MRVTVNQQFVLLGLLQKLLGWTVLKSQGVADEEGSQVEWGAGDVICGVCIHIFQFIVALKDAQHGMIILITGKDKK